jgi:hypothetical protein
VLRQRGGEIGAAGKRFRGDDTDRGGGFLAAPKDLEHPCRREPSAGVAITQDSPQCRLGHDPCPAPQRGCRCDRPCSPPRSRRSSAHMTDGQRQSRKGEKKEQIDRRQLTADRMILAWARSPRVAAVEQLGALPIGPTFPPQDERRTTALLPPGKGSCQCTTNGTRLATRPGRASGCRSGRGGGRRTAMVLPRTGSKIGSRHVYQQTVPVSSEGILGLGLGFE